MIRNNLIYDSGYTLHECKLGEGHTLDEVMTIITRQMQDEERRHRDEVAAIYSELYRIQLDKTIKKHNAKVSLTK